MQIQNKTYSPKFQGLNMSRQLNYEQLNIAGRFTASFVSTKAFKESSPRNIDVYLMPHKNAKSVIVLFMDNISGMFFKKSKKITKLKLQIDSPLTTNNAANSAELILNKIFSGEIERPRPYSLKERCLTDRGKIGIDFFRYNEY